MADLSSSQVKMPCCDHNGKVHVSPFHKQTNSNSRRHLQAHCLVSVTFHSNNYYVVFNFLLFLSQYRPYAKMADILKFFCLHLN